VFQRDGYLDFVNLLPAVPINPASAQPPATQWNSAFYQSFVRMYQGADVASELATLQALVDKATEQEASLAQ